MKKSKVLFSFLFALVFVFQLASAAFAAPADGVAVDESVSISYKLTAEIDNADGTEGTEFAEIPGENEEALLGGVCEVSLGDALLTRGVGGAALQSVINGEDIKIAVPAGYYVSALALRAENDQSEAVDLLDRAEAKADSANIKLPASAITVSDDEGVYLDASAVTGDKTAQSFVLDITLTRIDPEAEITVAEITVSEGESILIPDEGGIYTASAAPEYDAVLEQFMGWKLTYDNGSSVLVAADAVIVPYASCTLTAVIKPVVYNISVAVNDLEITAGNAPEFTSVITPEGVSADVSYSVYKDGEAVSAEALEAGEYTVDAGISNVTLNGTDLPEANYAVSVSSGKLTVAAAPVQEPQDPEQQNPPTAGDNDNDNNSNNNDNNNEGEPSGTDPIIGSEPSDNTPAEPTKLTINVKPPKYDEQSKQYVADGYTQEGLADGDTIKSVEYKITEADGKVVCTIVKLEIVDSTGSSVSVSLDGIAAQSEASAKYAATIVPGEILKPADTATELTVTAKSGSHEYDGGEYTLHEFDITSGALESGEKLIPKFKDSSKITNVGEVANEIESWEIQTTDGTVVQKSTDITGKYKVTTAAGKLTVTKRDASVSVKNDIVLNSNGSTAFALASGHISGSNFVNGHNYVITKWHVEQNGKTVDKATAAGDYTVVIDECKVYKDLKTENGKITGGTDVTGNYNLTLNSGKVTIKVNEKAISLTITAKSASFVYDGTAHTVDGYEKVEGLKDGDKLVSVKYKSTVTQTIPGEVSTEIESCVIQTADGKAVASDKYVINYVPGKLTVTKPQLTLTAESATKAYDGKALNNNNVSVNTKLDSKFKLSVGLTVTDKAGNSVRNGPVNVGTYTKKISSVKIMMGDTDVTEYFDIKRVDGTLTITSSDKNNSTGVKTGDESNLGLWIGILVVCAVVIVGIVVFVVIKKKKAANSEPSDLNSDDDNNIK